MTEVITYRLSLNLSGFGREWNPSLFKSNCFVVSCMFLFSWLILVVFTLFLSHELEIYHQEVFVILPLVQKYTAIYTYYIVLCCGQCFENCTAFQYTLYVYTFIVLFVLNIRPKLIPVFYCDKHMWNLNYYLLINLYSIINKHANIQCYIYF